ncbi:MAG: replication initiator protein A [Bdellovibrionales bacterium]|nr:replication initiator protein A [Bdellovibrionales bacterium]
MSEQIEFFSSQSESAFGESAYDEAQAGHSNHEQTSIEASAFVKYYGAKNPLTPSRYSRDEMNLAEFPLSVLSTRVSPNKKTLEFEDTIYDKNGQPVKRQWIITAADKFGLPTASDDEVLLGLLKISVDKGLDQRKVYFTRYELLKALRWSTEGRSYKRLTNALDRLSGVRIKASNSFYDNDSKGFSTRNFGIIDEYEINSGKSLNPKPSFFVWSEVLHKSFRSGFIKKLDFDYFLKLESAVSKRLYRFLDKHFWYRSKFSMNLFTLAHEKIGVSRTYKYPSSLRQQIDPAVEELVASGFLSHVEYSGKGQGTEVTFYAAGENGRRKERRGRAVSDPHPHRVNLSAHGQAFNSGQLASPSMASPSRPSTPEIDGVPVVEGVRRGVSSLVEKLTARGIVQKQAERLSYQIELNECEQRAEEILKYFDKLVRERSSSISRNAPGFLYRALEKPWDFSLPSDQPQQSKTQKSRSSKEFPKRISRPEDLELRYLTERKREISRLQGQLEPEMLKSLEQEVAEALQNIKDLVSDSGFKEAVRHGVDEKIAKLFAVPSFDEWVKSRR